MNNNKELFSCFKCGATDDLFVCFHCSIKPIIICEKHNIECHRPPPYQLHKRISLDIYSRYMRAIFFNDRYENHNNDTNITNNEKNILVFVDNFDNSIGTSKTNLLYRTHFRPGKKTFNIVNTYNAIDKINIVSFFSPEPNGKSFLIRSLIPEEEILPNLQGNDCHLYAYDDTKNKILYLDYPSLSKFKSNVLGQELYLQLSYVFSDVICQPIIGSLNDLNNQLKYFKNISSKAKIYREKYSPINPSLIVILNHKTIYEHQENYDLSIDNFEIIHQTTKFIIQKFLSPEINSILANLFSDIWFVNINRLINYECIMIKQCQRLSKLIHQLLLAGLPFKNENQMTMTLIPNMFEFIEQYNN